MSISPGSARDPATLLTTEPLPALTDEQLGGSAEPANVVVLEGPDEGRQVRVDHVLLVGTDPDANLTLTDGAVSRRHVSIRAKGAMFVVKDLGSRNGTFLGSSRVTEAEVPLGAVLRVGKTSLGLQPRWHTQEVAPSVQRTFGELAGHSIMMREAFALLERAARADVTVLIEGESGTGKELAARSLHAASPRAKGPYVVFDCGAVPSELAESELFGHKKGSFSGATADRAGAFLAANEGTICLDELGELPRELQPRLLRVLETGEVKPVGSDVARKLNVRVIASTNRDLRSEVRRGRFRSDLYYRLEVVKVRLPPLRSRLEDLGLILECMFKDKLREDCAIDGENLRRLMAYGWPGNVRELRNTMERAITLNSGTRPAFSELVFNLGPAAETPSTLGTTFPGTASRVPYKEAKAQLVISFERAYLSALLGRHKGNVTHAAQEAGLSRKHLYELMRRVDDGSDG